MKRICEGVDNAMRQADQLHKLVTQWFHSIFKHCLQLAMLFGGNVNTIMSMTGVIAGAYFGESGIPDYMKRICERVDNAMRQADQLHKLVTQWFYSIF